ncbi:asparagine synthase-related protein [Amycolatopsis sp. H20-H5]|uniref:asparagine synthase-related protein n=1 Tax=Amycolatopsis sp. H20-H5 TaxID=3046309 RepID=UPI002DB6C377|nr:asparagine synthase-related protein [Amycolatopsis sp. H20-H5]MEC3975571.1 asparagine synthase-related protein [Amycolatopsis sp. H20-H5]
MGRFTVTEHVLAKRLCREDIVPNLSEAFGDLAGSHHLLLSDCGRTRVQGTVSGLRLVFHARLADVPVVSDRSDVLAALTGADVDSSVLALALLGQTCPHPLVDRSVWQGVTAVPPGYHVTIDNTAARTERWWNPPDADLSVREGAQLMLQALVTGVDARTTAGGTMSADLSGGLDSTPLSFLAARNSSALIAVTQSGDHARNDDEYWATRAASYLPNCQHLIYPFAKLPLPYADFDVAMNGPDEPGSLGRMWGRQVVLASRVADAGSRVHLNGQGGDEVLRAPMSYVHDLITHRPREAWRHIQPRRARGRWTLGATMAALADRRTYRRWLESVVADLTPRLDGDRRTPPFGWSSRPQLPPWASAHASETARDLIIRASGEAEPLGRKHSVHSALVSVQGGARAMRHLGRLTAAFGVSLELPFYDKAVIEAGLAVRPEESAAPWDFKPVMVEAMCGIVPDELLARRTKGAIGADIWAGLDALRPMIADWIDNLRLAEHGLVDRDALRRACLDLYPPRLPTTFLETTLGLEAWLRAQENRDPFRGDDASAALAHSKEIAPDAAS